MPWRRYWLDAGCWVTKLYYPFIRLSIIRCNQIKDGEIIDPGPWGDIEHEIN